MDRLVELLDCPNDFREDRGQSMGPSALLSWHDSA